MQATYGVTLRPGQPNQKETWGLTDKAAVERWVTDNGNPRDQFRCTTQGPTLAGAGAIEEGMVAEDGSVSWRVG